jgi:hypothetical protein
VQKIWTRLLSQNSRWNQIVTSLNSCLDKRKFPLPLHLFSPISFPRSFICFHLFTHARQFSFLLSPPMSGVLNTRTVSSLMTYFTYVVRTWVSARFPWFYVFTSITHPSFLFVFHVRNRLLFVHRSHTNIYLFICCTNCYWNACAFQIVQLQYPVERRFVKCKIHVR